MPELFTIYMPYTIIFVKFKGKEDREYVCVDENIRLVCSFLQQAGAEVSIDKYNSDWSLVKLNVNELQQQKIDEYGFSQEEGVNYYVLVDLTNSNISEVNFKNIVQDWKGKYLDKD